MFATSIRILIVDDMPSLRDLLKAYLRRLGYLQISEAGDGKDAFQLMVAAKASGSPFDMVISDWNMPVMTGLELLKMVRAQPEWKLLPFILLTTESEKGRVLEAVHAQVSNYMVKPVEEEVLKEKMLKVWEKLNPPKPA